MMLMLMLLVTAMLRNLASAFVRSGGAGACKGIAEKKAHARLEKAARCTPRCLGTYSASYFHLE
eukprot:5313298-Pleurochrysis_carterae.AAC.2